VRGSGAASRAEIRGVLEGLNGITEPQRRATESQYVALGVSADRLQQLVQRGTATTEDQRELRRVRDRMGRMLVQLGAGPGAREDERREPIDASDRAAFCAKHLTVADGGPFTLTGREWQRDQFWAPLDGFKLWPVDHAKLCADCRQLSGRIVQSVYEADATRSHEPGCAGLYAHVIWLVAQQLKRQQGKTTAVAGFAVSSLFRHVRESIAYVAGSEDQTEGLFRVNFGTPVATSEHLGPRAKVLGKRLVVPETESEFGVFATSLAGAAGGSRTLVIIDEARDVPSRVFGALVPQVYARNGWRCPSGKIGHDWSTGDLRLLEDRAGTAVDPTQERYGKKCGVCAMRLEPWSGRVAVMSSAQELDGSDADWFHDLCESLEEEQQPDAHVYRSSLVINPKVQRQIVARTESVLGKVRGLSDTMSIEAGGISKRKGEPYLSSSDINACMDKTLVNRESGERPGVAVLDTSDVYDPTSLVIVEDESLLPDGDEPGEDPWTRIVTTRIDVFRPRERDHDIVRTGIVDPGKLEAFLDEIVPLFKLLKLRIDDRHHAWVRKMLARLQAKPWGRIVEGCTKLVTVDRELAYNEMERRFKGGLLRVQSRADLRQELVGARKHRDRDNRTDVRESGSRNKSGVRHLDIADALAWCCYDVHAIASKPKKRGLADVVEAQGRVQVSERLRRLRGRSMTKGIGPDSF